MTIKSKLELKKTKTITSISLTHMEEGKKKHSMKLGFVPTGSRSLTAAWYAQLSYLN